MNKVERWSNNKIRHIIQFDLDMIDAFLDITTSTDYDLFRDRSPTFSTYHNDARTMLLQTQEQHTAKDYLYKDESTNWDLKETHRRSNKIKTIHSIIKDFDVPSLGWIKEGKKIAHLVGDMFIEW